MKSLRIIALSIVTTVGASLAHAQIFYDNTVSQSTVGPYSSTDEIADDVPFSGTQHVSSFTFKYSNTTSGPLNGTARFYDVNQSTGLVGNLVASVPLNNLAVGHFQIITINLSPSEEFDWTATPGIYGLQSVSGGFFSLQLMGADFEEGWYEAAGASLDGFEDVTTGQFVNFGGDINASFYLQISSTSTTVAVSSVSLNPTSVSGGRTSVATITLTAPAPSGGAVVKLLSSKPQVATLPANITIPAGATSANTTIRTKAVAALTKVTISAAYGGVTKTAILTITH